jgi:hypothetical protein
MEQVNLQLIATVKQLTETNNSLTEQLKEKEEQIKQLNDKMNIYMKYMSSYTPVDDTQSTVMSVNSQYNTDTHEYDTILRYKGQEYRACGNTNDSNTVSQLPIVNVSPEKSLIQQQIEQYVNDNYMVIQKGRGENKEQPMTMKSFVDDIKQQSFYNALTTIEKRKYGMKWIKDIMSLIVRVETPKNRGCEIYIKKKQSQSIKNEKIEQKVESDVPPRKKSSTLIKETIKPNYGLGEKQQPKQKYELLFTKNKEEDDIPLTESDEQFFDDDVRRLIESAKQDEDYFNDNFEEDFEINEEDKDFD